MADSTIDVSKDAGDAASAEGGGSDGPCVSDPNWCVTHCLNSNDNCGLSRTCPDCTTGLRCDSQTRTCKCLPDPNWCMGRCGDTTNNCGDAQKCPDCDGSMCNANNACGDCDANNGACLGRSCGSAINGCGQLIGCGFNGSYQCVGSQVCLDGGNCCQPDYVTPCQGKCSGEPETTCGLSFHCVSCMDAGLTCLNGQCCNQAACGGPCLNQCGGSDQNCCPPDAGDGGMGMCLQLGAPCDAASQCCSMNCVPGMGPRGPSVEAGLGGSNCM